MSFAKSLIKTETNEMARSEQNGFLMKRAMFHRTLSIIAADFNLSRLMEYIRLAVRRTQSECES